MEEESVLKGIFLPVVILDHVDGLEWSPVISTEPNESFNQLPVVVLKTLDDFWYCQPRVKWIVRLNDLCSHEKVEVYFLPKKFRDNRLLSDAIKGVEIIFFLLIKSSFHINRDLRTGKTSIKAILVCSIIDDLLRNLDTDKNFRDFGSRMWIHYINDKVFSFD
jgi:hypothetical protein